MAVMRNWRRTAVLVALFAMIFLLKDETILAKTRKVTMNLTGAKIQNKYPAALDKAKKVTVRSSKKSVVQVKYQKKKGIRRIVLTAKKLGKATVTVKCRMKNKRTKTYRYSVSVVKTKKVTALAEAKKAFKIQNRYRKEKGVAALEWSDELYQFCLYRIKTSGFDKHENLNRDINGYFGKYAKFKGVLFAENMYSGNMNPKSAMEAWKKSPGHYQNLLSSNHICGAIARYGSVWCAIFYDNDKSEIENWRDYQIKEITVKRYDSQSETYVSDCGIGYYESGNRWESLKVAAISETEGKPIYLEIGKTYVIYEKRTPDGCEKAEPITITVTEDGVSEVVLAS